MKTENKSAGWWRYLKSPWVNLAAVGIGVLLGTKVKCVVPYIAPIGYIYISALQMCVLPIILTAIMVSISKLFLSGSAGKYMKRLVAVFLIGVLMTSSAGVVAGMAGRPGANLSPESRKALAKIFVSSEDMKKERSTEGGRGFWWLLQSMVPSNVFTALSAGNSLAIVFFSIMFGAALGCSGKEEGREGLASLLESVYKKFFRILGWVLYGLPVGLICILSWQIYNIGADIMIALAKMVVIFYLGCIFLCILYTIIIKLASGFTFSRVLSGLKEPLGISFVVSSSIPAIPIAIERMSSEIKISKTVSNFAVPLGVVVNRQGYAMLFSLTSIFVAQLYQVDLGVLDIALIICASAVSGMAAVGAPAVIAPMIGYVLYPLGLPVSAGVAIFIAISPVVDHLLSMTNLYASCASASITGKGTHEPESDEELVS